MENRSIYQDIAMQMAESIYLGLVESGLHGKIDLY